MAHLPCHCIFSEPAGRWLQTVRPWRTVPADRFHHTLLLSTPRGQVMRRRDFLKTTAAASAAVWAAGAAPRVLNAGDKSGTRNPILGKGEHKYECIHGWGQLPK